MASGNVNWHSHCGEQYAAAAAKSLQSCPTLCDPIDSSPPGSPVPGILQARTLEWVAMSFSNAWKWKVKVKSLSRVRLFVTPQTAAHQAPLSMGFSRQEYWSGVPLPSLGEQYGGSLKTKNRATLWPCNPTLGIYPEKNMIWKDTCTPMFIADLFTIARTWKQPKCPSTDPWIKKMWSIYTAILLSH